MVNMNTVSAALKNYYIAPLREDINLKADPLYARISHTTNNIVGYNKIVRAALVGANGGAGAGSETGALPSSGENTYAALESTTKNLYGTIEISDKLVRSAADSSAGSFVNMLQQEMETLTRTLRWNLARQLYGDGSGKLCTVSTAVSAGTTLSVSSTAALLPGLKVDIFAAAGTSLYRGVRILDVDHGASTVKIDTSATVPQNGYLTIQGSAGYELTGLGKLFDGTGSGTLYGLDRSEYSWLNPYIVNSFGEITETGLQSAIDHLEDSYNVNVNHINCGSDAYNYYLALMNKRRCICDTSTLEGGHRALLFNGIPLTRTKFMPADSIDLYDTGLFEIDQVADWEWIEGESHNVLHQKPGYPTYTATIAKYCDLMCVLPGGIARLNGVDAPQ